MKLITRHAMRTLSSGPIVLAALLLTSGLATADHLPPVHPLVAGGDHSHEDHVGHDHSFEVIPNINFTEAGLDQVDFTGATVDGAIFTGVVIGFAILSWAQVKSAGDVTGIGWVAFVNTGNDLSGVDFTDSAIVMGWTSNANFSGTNFTNVRIDYSAIDQANCSGANFTNASLSFLSSDEVDCTGANFTDATLRLNLDNAECAGADFTNAVAEGFSVIGSNLTNATGLSTITGDVEYNIFTNFTGTGFDPVAGGWTLIVKARPLPALSPGAALILLLTLALLGTRAISG